MSHSDVRTHRTGPQDRFVLVLDIERVLDAVTRQPVRAEFRFTPDAPLAVDTVLAVEDGPRVRWRIGRDLLRRGLYAASGLGAVRMWPSSSETSSPDVPSPKRGKTAWLQLASGDMAALFELPVPRLAAWLEHTYRVVPEGEELSGIDWDAATADLLRT